MDSSIYIGPIVGCCVFALVLISACLFRYFRFSLYRKQIRGTLGPVVVGPRAPSGAIQSSAYRPGGSGVAVVSNFSGNGLYSYPPYGGAAFYGEEGCYPGGPFIAGSNGGVPPIGGDFFPGGPLPPPPFPPTDSMPPPPRYESVAYSNVMNLQNAADCGGVYTLNTTGTENVRAREVLATNEGFASGSERGDATINSVGRDG